MVKSSASPNLEVPPQGSGADPPEVQSPTGAAVLAVLLAATCWSFIGVAYRLILDEFDVSPVTLVAIRATTSAVVLSVVILARPAFRAQLSLLGQHQVLLSLLGGGLIGGTGFYIALVYAYEVAGVAVGTVLLYLAPSFVALGAWLAFKQRITRTQRVALVMSFLGVVGVSGVITGANPLRPAGLILGLTAAVCYGSYSLFGHQLLKTLHPIVVVGLTGVIGSAGIWLIKLAVEGPGIPSTDAVLWIMVSTGVGTTLIPLLLYTWGLSKLGAPRASMLTTIEPVLAVALAFVILNETLTTFQMGGGVLVIVSVFVAGLEHTTA